MGARQRQRVQRPGQRDAESRVGPAPLFTLACTVRSTRIACCGLWLGALGGACGSPAANAIDAATHGAGSDALDAGLAADARVTFFVRPDQPLDPRARAADAGRQPPHDSGSSTTCSGAGACTDAARCEGGGCALGDLALELIPPAQPMRPRRQQVAADDCELDEGCLGGAGERVLLELGLVVHNVGAAPIELGRPWQSPLFRLSSCQRGYVIDGFFAAELRDAAGDSVAAGRLSSTCLASAAGGYDCSLQGLAAGESSEQPTGLCDVLDVTGLPDGDYTLAVTVNPDRALAETRFDNNRAEIAIHYAGCRGTACGDACCPEGVACVEGVCMLPDLRLEAQVAAASLFLTHQTFAQDSCELAEMCVSGSGPRRLLQFEGRVENWGPGELNPGSERGNPLFEYSSCHDHYHFRDFTDYRLLHQDGTIAALGHKQSFCLFDMEPIGSGQGPAPPNTHPEPGAGGCSYLSAGWADIYSVGTPCQWIDVTGLPEGDYLLVLSVNPLGRVAEAITDNNTVEIPVHIPADPPCAPLQSELCGDILDQDCDGWGDLWDPDCN